MKRYGVLKIMAIIVYLFIMIPGFMMYIPLGICLLSWIVAPPSLALQFYSIGALTGIIIIAIMFRKQHSRKKMYTYAGAFILLVLPIVECVIAFPALLLSSAAFYIPVIGFIFFFLLYVVMTYRKSAT